ncbi:MAG: saccharopine dehydrogenase C-terminal domain-containing protein [Lentimicrobium sp.]|jgi:saccharopine dehydrogenase-like NADP-dependent oxidoreductase|nr:saccharopine dehydrogenase C-terminal domain-containing protein [Lentimicrobium sp.]
MKRILILGAGMVAHPIVNHLLTKNHFVTVANPDVERAEQLIQGFTNGRAVYWTIDDQEGLENMVADHDITVSLLPFSLHVEVAKVCIEKLKPMVTTSYISPEMQALDAQAKAAGIIILNEMGLDPGIDHMSAMRIIDKIHEQGGKIEEFYSFCGALPAPEAADNPFKYKFSWSPKGVIMAGNNDARYLRQGKLLEIPTADLFKNPIIIDFDNIGKLEVYPNRDSVSYIDIYGIPEAKTMMRGTFRYEGWCESMDLMKRLGLITSQTIDMKGMTYAYLLAHTTGINNTPGLRAQIAEKFDITPDSKGLDALAWLGFFSDEPIGRGVDTPFEVSSDLMISKMGLGHTERDMVIMQHTFLVVHADGQCEVVRSRMMDFGSPATDTSIARTVALPAALAVEMILSGNIRKTGVFRPVIPAIYNPVLDELEKLNICMTEEFGLPESENIG